MAHLLRKKYDQHLRWIPGAKKPLPVNQHPPVVAKWGVFRNQNAYNNIGQDPQQIEGIQS